LSCARSVDWPALLAHRFERHADEPAGYADALAHAGACVDCRRAALRLDPSLLFGVLGEPTREAEHEREADGEVERMLAAVDNLRRLQRIEAVRPRRHKSHWRWPAAAGFLIALLSLAPASVVQRAGSLPPAAALSLPAQWSIAPVVEPLGGEARIYELDSASDLAVVLIVDQTIDV
jgi:hypothetical protein